MHTTLPGGMPVTQFLADYWQKRPLYVPAAFPELRPLLSPDALLELAARDDVESRLVSFQRGEWRLHHGPVKARDWKSKAEHRTLLIQNVNHECAAAADLLFRFAFVPFARLDDLMISYSSAGGSVGPHFDSYDVFLIQGSGHKRWQISEGGDLRLVEGAPLRILEQFNPQQEWTLGPGDMLYLPPRFAHYGVALDEGTTYSVGFRAPSAQELGTQFLVYLQDRIALDGMFQDPGRAPVSDPAQLDDAMVHQVERMLQEIRWDRGDVENFLGCYLSEPKAHVYFDGPDEPLSRKAFAKVARQGGVRLSLKSQMLLRGTRGFINGEPVDPAFAGMEALANQRQLAGQDVHPDSLDVLYEWYTLGWLDLNS